MPPRTAPIKLTTEKKMSDFPHTALSYRKPSPPETLPPTASIPPLWRTDAMPTEVFPEWTDPTTLSAEHWCTLEQPFNDFLTPKSVLVPDEAKDLTDTITWKRPSEFLPMITQEYSSPQPESKIALKKSTVFGTENGGFGNLSSQKKTHICVYKSNKSSGLSNSSSTLPPTAILQQHDHVLRIPRDFQRRWSAEQLETWEAWAKEEERIKQDLQHRELVYMSFEDAIAYIVNERPTNGDFDSDDLVDDGIEDEILLPSMNLSYTISPWGMAPPPRMEITPNSVYKPEIPRGDIIHSAMASYFRIVEQLYHSSNRRNHDGITFSVPFLWQAIYPQDSDGQPVYNPGGKYSVKLFVLGRWRRVDIDDKLPLDSNGNYIYLSSSLKYELWPCLLVKALYTAMYMLHSTLVNQEVRHQQNMCQDVIQTMLALTSWKVSRWEHIENDISNENVFHQVLEYVPSSRQSRQAEGNSEGISASEGLADGTTDDSQSVTLKKPSTENNPKPCAAICYVGVNKIAHMAPGELVLVTDVVGDFGSTIFKVVRQGAPVTISEESTGYSELIVLLIHPPLQFSDTVVREWKPNAEFEQSDNLSATLVPFEAPRVQFVVITVQDPISKHLSKQLSGSVSSGLVQKRVNFVASLTSIQPPEELNRRKDHMCNSLAYMANHRSIDANDSVILIEMKDEMTLSTSSPPSIITLDSTFSRFISISPEDQDKIVYRLYLQQTLRYGYSIEVESDHNIVLQDAPTYWRSLSKLHVMECDGQYPVMLPNTWNILLKYSFELLSSTQKDEDMPPSSPDLNIDFHLSEDLLKNFSHVTIVNDRTGKTEEISTLCTKITLPSAFDCATCDGINRLAYTIVVDCVPGNFHVREGKWNLTLASEWKFSKPLTHNMKVTSFEGVYEPNSSLLCFRDVIVAPKTSIWTSFQFQFQSDAGPLDNLVPQLTIFDAATNQPLQIREITSRGETRVLQLPFVSAIENGQAPSGKSYIIQGSIDQASSVVPNVLWSLCPFRSTFDSIVPKERTPASVDENAHSEFSLNILPLDLCRTSSGIKWKLTCWSTEEVKLQQDNATELKFKIVRASWAEKASNRTTNGAVSRLLYLGKLEDAKAVITRDKMTDEQIVVMRSRFEWIQAAKANVVLKTGASETNLKEIKVETKEQVWEEDFTERKRLLREQMDAVDADKDQRLVSRLLDKEVCANETKYLIQSVIDRRASSTKKQQKLTQQLALMQTLIV
ncbi:putative peptidase C2, calpain, catalytic domain, papain-like cysteine peptidase superfamily [Plasmopara halstedii]